MNKMYRAYKGRNTGIVIAGKEIYKVPKYFILRDNRFILPISFLRYFLKTKEGVENKSLSIAYHPGFACNLKCSYCYQETEDFRKPSFKKSNNINLNAEFISKYIKNNGYESLDITYIGGETMLYMKDIMEFHQKLLSTKIKINSSFVTNATIVNREIISSMAEMNCKSIQITLDGDKESHNIYRFYKNSKGTFDDVVNNIKILYSSLESQILVRVNVTGQNIYRINKLLESLEDRLDIEKFSIYFSLIDDTVNFKDDKGNIYKFLEEYRNIYKNAISKGFDAVLPSHSGNCLTCKIPSDCNSVSNDGIVITADGKLYSCWDSAGQPNKEVGNTREGYIPELVENNWVQCGYNSDDKAIQEKARNIALVEILDR